MTPPLDATPVRLRGVDVDLAGRPVLRQADLEVSAGELVALLGANGSGKSTLVRAAIGLVPHRSGTVELFGVPLARFRDRRRIGYVPQRSASASGVPASVREVVLSGRLARRRLIGPATRADRAAVAEAVERVGLADRLRSPVTELSGGQHQRVLIARALVGEPELLIMDEPLAGVDRANAEKLATVLADFTTGGGSVLVVEHDLGPLQPVVNRAIVLDHGQIIYAGPPGEAPGEHAHVHPHTAEPPRLAAVPGEGVI